VKKKEWKRKSEKERVKKKEWKRKSEKERVKKKEWKRKSEKERHRTKEWERKKEKERKREIEGERRRKKEREFCDFLHIQSLAKISEKWLRVSRVCRWVSLKKNPRVFKKILTIILKMWAPYLLKTTLKVTITWVIRLPCPNNDHKNFARSLVNANLLWACDDHHEWHRYYKCSLGA
jgi:hypothetical protein